MELESELLCSPKKIRKLNSNSQTALMQKLSQGSQESRATSTPTKRKSNRKLSISSDISTIANVNSSDSKTSVENQGETDASDLVADFQELSLDGTSISSIGTYIEQRPNQQIFRGKVWNSFKPKYPESLYARVLKNFRNVEEIIFELLGVLKSDEKEGSLILIKYFIDLCGYQEVTVENQFDFNNFLSSCEKMIKKMEFDLVGSKMLEAKTYIFFEADKETKLGGVLAYSIHSFIEKLLVGAYCQNILFSKCFHKYIFKFIFYMCQSVLRPIRHTGVALVRLILKVLNYIYMRIMKRMVLGNSHQQPDSLPIEKEIEYMEKYIQTFFNIFAKNSFIPDAKLYILRAKNVTEIGNWMLELPQIYSINCISCLSKLQVDESALVRLNTIQVWKKLIKPKILHPHVAENLVDIVKAVMSRLHDVELKVVVTAIEFFGELSKQHLHLITEDVTCIITELLYASNYKYAKAAASFTIKTLKLSDKDVFMKLLHISNIPKFQGLKLYLVESFIEQHTVLENYKLIMEVLLTMNFKDNIKAVDIIELMYYSVYQKLKGQAVRRRKNSLTASPSTFGHEEVAKVILSNLNDFVKIFKDNKDVMDYWLNILLLIDYEELPPSYQPQLMLLTKISRIIFLNEYHEEILEKISKLYHYLSVEKKTSVKDYTSKFVTNLFESLSTYLKEYLESDSQKVELDLHFMRIGKFYENFNMNEFFDWRSLFSVWGNKMLCKGQMIACQHHILWTAKDLSAEKTGKSDEYREAKIKLSSCFFDYSSSLLEIIKSVDNVLRFDAFESYCLLHLLLYEVTLRNEELNDLRHQEHQKLKSHASDSLCLFITRDVLRNTSLKPERRQKLICDWLNLAFNSLIDVFYTIPLFELYHKKWEEYGPLIEYGASIIFSRKPELLFQILVATLIKQATYIFNTLCRSLTSPEARDLMALAQKFSNMKEISDCSNGIIQMLDMGFNHCFRNGVTELLVVFQNFLPKLSEKHYKLCLDIFTAKVPKEYGLNKYVKTFKEMLLAGKSKGNLKTTRTSMSSSDLSLDFKKPGKTSLKTPRKKTIEKKSLPLERSSHENDENISPKKKHKISHKKNIPQK